MQQVSEMCTQSMGCRLVGLIKMQASAQGHGKGGGCGHLCGTLPGLGAGLHLGLADGLVWVGGLVINVLDAWWLLPLHKQQIDQS